MASSPWIYTNKLLLRGKNEIISTCNNCPKLRNSLVYFANDVHMCKTFVKLALQLRKFVQTLPDLTHRYMSLVRWVHLYMTSMISLQYSCAEDIRTETQFCTSWEPWRSQIVTSSPQRGPMSVDPDTRQSVGVLGLTAGDSSVWQPRHSRCTTTPCAFCRGWRSQCRGM